MKKTELINEGLDKITRYKRNQKSLKGWFLYQEIKMLVRKELSGAGKNPDAPENQAEILCECVKRMPLSIPAGSVIAGTQDDAFSPSYALINPSFRVETFAGYCDPLAVYDDIKPDKKITLNRIKKVRSYYASTDYVNNLYKVYQNTGIETQEVAYFVEPVTGHVIPDCRPVLKKGMRSLRKSSDKTSYSKIMKASLLAPVILAERYAKLAKIMVSETNDENEKKRLRMIVKTCQKVPLQGAENLHEAIQSYALQWQVMCLEQAPNPYAFSVGNLDRILQPYLRNTSFEEAVALVRHFLAFLMVGDRCWAISQNVMVGGMDANGKDLTDKMTGIVLEAFYRSNNPQPALSVKIHENTPDKIYEEMGRFFFTPGHSTPSLFNDNSLFKIHRINMEII